MDGKRRGFTLVEVLIVVVILGILAATVLPQFTSANDDAKESAFVQDLQTLRSQIQLYRFQHDGAFPGSGTDPDTFRDAMLLASNVAGQTAAIGTAGYPLGPYFVGTIPPNPFTGGRGLLLVADVAGTTPNEALTDIKSGEVVGWIYSPTTGVLKGNNSGTGSDSVPLEQY